MALNRAIGLSVSRLDTGEVIYEHNPTKPFIPASCMKLVTMAAALHYLGPEYRFETRFFADGRVEGGVLLGNLIVQGSGDPSLSDAELTEAAEGIRRTGLKEVRGNLLLDDAAFDDGARGAAGVREALKEGLPLTSALAYNFNAVEIGASAGDKLGGAAVLRDTGYGYLDVVNRVKTSRSGYPWIRLSRFRNNKVVVNGRVRPGAEELVGRAVATEPPRFLGAALAGKLRERGIAVRGGIEPAVVPPSATLLYVHRSPALIQMLELLGKNSNNFAAEQILKALGAHRWGTPATVASGARTVSEYLSSLGFERGEFSVRDGSGLSYENRLSADVLRRVLTELYLSDLKEDFLCALALGGVDGTLQRRLRDESHLGRVMAKTGSLSGISSLSGFAFSPTRGTLAFSILLNGIGRQWRGNRAEDEIAKLLLSP